METSSYNTIFDGSTLTSGGNQCKHCGHNLEAQNQPTSTRSGRSFASSGSGKRFIMAYRGRIVKLSILTFFSLMFMSIYVTYFRHPTPDVLLKMNQQSPGGAGQDFGASSFQRRRAQKANDKIDDILDEKEEDDDENEEDRPSDDSFIKHSKRELVQNEVTGSDYWNKFLKINNYVPIGAVYDKCDGSKNQLGTVILEEDKELGGVRAKTFVNMTLEHEITGGQFYIEVKYNGQDLYDNYWSLCELEDDLPVQNRTFTCPITPGKWSKIKNKHVPGYLPTGRYQTKAWALDDSENVIACGFSDFKL